MREALNRSSSLAVSYFFVTYSRNFFPQQSYILTWTFGLRSHSFTGWVTSLPQFGHFIFLVPAPHYCFTSSYVFPSLTSLVPQAPLHHRNRNKRASRESIDRLFVPSSFRLCLQQGRLSLQFTWWQSLIRKGFHSLNRC